MNHHVVYLAIIVLMFGISCWGYSTMLRKERRDRALIGRLQTDLSFANEYKKIYHDKWKELSTKLEGMKNS